MGGGSRIIDPWHVLVRYLNSFQLHICSHLCQIYETQYTTPCSDPSSFYLSWRPLLRLIHSPQLLPRNPSHICCVLPPHKYRTHNGILRITAKAPWLLLQSISHQLCRRPPHWKNHKSRIQRSYPGYFHVRWPP